jgi:hypothetical protein
LTFPFSRKAQSPPLLSKLLGTQSASTQLSYAQEAQPNYIAAHALIFDDKIFHVPNTEYYFVVA